MGFCNTTVPVVIKQISHVGIESVLLAQHSYSYCHQCMDSSLSGCEFRGISECMDISSAHSGLNGSKACEKTQGPMLSLNRWSHVCTYNELLPCHSYGGLS